jgi:thioredoxin:protein disulfide reductase
MFKRISLIFFILFIFYRLGYGQETDQLKIKSYTDKETYSNSDTIKIAIKVDIKEKYHINSYQVDDSTLIKTTLTLESDKFKTQNIYFPADELLKFEFSDNKIRVYEGGIIIGYTVLPAKDLADGEYAIPINFNYQSCDNSVCYPPKSVELDLKIKINKEKASKTLINKDIFGKIDFSKPTTLKKEETKLTENTREEGSNPDESTVSNFIEEKGLFLGLFFIFLGGLALNLTPCIYPLIPITISYFGAQSSGSTFQRVMMGVFYALGMAVTYSALGLFAALTGSLLGTALQNPIVIVLVALVLVALASSMFGFWEIRVPQKLALAGNKNRTGYFGSLLMGLLVGFIAAPCIGPFVLSLLVYVGKIGSPFMGFLLFFVLSIGLGIPYIFLAMFSGSISKLPRSGEWMEGVKTIFGLILIGMGLNTLAPLFNKDLFNVVFPLYIILAGIYILLIDKKGKTSNVFTKIKIVIGIIAIIYGTWGLKPEKQTEIVNWKALNSVEEIEKTIKDKKMPVMIDFYADWCAQCKELDEYTYTDKEIVNLSKSLNNIKIDLTKENKSISDKYGVKGLPVVLFINSNGEEIRELRVTGFLKPQDFSKKINKLLELNKK